MLTFILILLVLGLAYLVYEGISWPRIVLFFGALWAAVISLDWNAVVALFT